MPNLPSIPPTDSFQSVSVILPVLDEIVSLTKTVETLLASASADIREIIIVVCERTTRQARANVAELQKAHPQLIVVHEQTLPFVGGAYREAFDMALGSHVLLMASDLETDPATAPAMIAAAKLKPSAVIATSRWLNPGSFHGYNRVKLVGNWLFQKIFTALYSTNLTDMTFGYRLYPRNVLQSIKWEEARHPFFLETIVKPLRLGVPAIEIATSWIPRNEGESHNSFFASFDYLRPALKVCFASPSTMLKDANAAQPKAPCLGSADNQSDQV
jgi:glycosyltransferase involved in cell wall biosynthesis